MLDFGIKVCLDSHSILDADHPLLHVHVFDGEDILDIVMIVAFFGLSNWMVNMVLMWPPAELYLMGEISK